MNSNESGASSSEYALLIVGIAAVIVVAIFALGPVVIDLFDSTCEEIDKVTSASCTP